jgi:glucosyl-dolichyl phosphate glucuronosyltransferase
VQRQTLPSTEIIVVIDHNPQLLKRVQDDIPGVIAIENCEVRGLSGARNSGVAIAKGQIVAFLDDDAIAIPDWLEFLCQGFEDPAVLGTGGSIIPAWPDKKVSWFPEEFLWVVGCTYRGMPQVGDKIRNPIGANMAFRREVFDGIGGFKSEIGRVGARLTGGEETELCIRASQRWPEGVFLYRPSAKVMHRVTEKRASWRYFCARCYAEGFSKAFVAKSVGTQDGLASERAYIFNVLPGGVLKGFTNIFYKKGILGVMRSLAILVGFMMTVIGYVIGILQRHHIGSSSNVQRSSSSQINGSTSRSAMTQVEA